MAVQPVQTTKWQCDQCRRLYESQEQAEACSTKERRRQEIGEEERQRRASAEHMSFMRERGATFKTISNRHGVSVETVKSRLRYRDRTIWGSAYGISHRGRAYAVECLSAIANEK